jgi:membrane protease YdiL (CAAX protease family)
LALTFVLVTQLNVRTVLAHRYLVQFFDAFNILPQAGLHFGGVAVAVVLLLWHVLNRDPWWVNVKSLWVMALESLILVMPLFVLGIVLNQLFQTPAVLSATNLSGEMTWASKLAISIGAGLYEELMFRMLLIAVLHTILVDLGHASERLGSSIAIIVSAMAFAWYHPSDGSAHRLIFYFLAGIYFGAIYIFRGFGIVVGAHALYDIVAFSLFPAAQAQPGGG